MGQRAAPPTRRDKQRMAVIGGVVAAVVCTTGFGVYALVGEDGEQGNGSVSAGEEPDAKPTGPPTPKEVRTTSRAFLGAWSDGDVKKAAALTDDKSAAREALTGFRKDARISRIALAPGKPSQGEVPFDVSAQITYDELSESWAYDGELEVVREKSSGDVVVHWEPTVIHPKLEEDQSITTGEAGTPPIKAVDRNGAEVSKETHPSLTGVLADLRERYGDKTDGTPGIETRIVDAEGKDTGTTLVTLSKGTPGTLETTLDLNVQKAAESAIAEKEKAAVVAVKPSTGEILAVAEEPAGGFNTALQGSYAPGSTMKVITGAMLLDKGLASPDEQHPCPKYFTYGGWKFQNDDKFQIEDGTFSQSFARSCNTAFISQAPELDNDSLTKEARDVFGIGLNWQTGTTTMDGRVPVMADAQMAASLIGQGGVRMNPLNMASVSATVQSGAFKQPYLVSPELDGRTLAQAPRTMESQVASDLKSLMNLTAVSGTAAEPMAGMSGDFGAKTGSAEVGGQKKPNAWFTAYSGDIAAAAVVPESGHGGEHAGPVVRKVLDSYTG